MSYRSRVKWRNPSKAAALFLTSRCSSYWKGYQRSANNNNSIKIIVIIIIPFGDYHTSVSWWYTHWSLSDSKSPQVSKTLLSILVDLNNAVFLDSLQSFFISKSSWPRTNPLVIVPRAPITFGISVTFICQSLFFCCFFLFPDKVQVLIFFRCLSSLLCGRLR